MRGGVCPQSTYLCISLCEGRAVGAEKAAVLFPHDRRIERHAAAVRRRRCLVLKLWRRSLGHVGDERKSAATSWLRTMAALSARNRNGGYCSSTRSLGASGALGHGDARLQSSLRS